MTKNIPPLSTFLLLAALSGLAACGPNSGAQQAPAGAGAGAPPPPEVDTMAVSRGQVDLTQDLPGRLSAFRSAQVRARIEGIIEKRQFTEGSDVKAGETLFRIDARNYQATYEAASADEELARQTVERYTSLFDRGMVSQQDFDQVKSRHKLTEAALSRARLDLENTRVPAPIAGRIGRAQVTEGALVGRGDATLLATIEQVDPVYADFTQSGTDLLRLQQAFKSGKLKRSGSAQVQLVLEDGSIYAHPGQLMFSDLAVDPGTGSVSLRAKFPNPQQELLPGMFVRIRFAEASADDSIRVPQRAVMMGAQGQFVMTVDQESKAAPRPVKTGGMAGGDFVISEGLQPGDVVIVNGLQKARPGTVVKAVPLGQTTAAKP